jgi:hypothetical protein
MIGMAHPSRIVCVAGKRRSDLVMRGEHAIIASRYSELYTVLADPTTRSHHETKRTIGSGKSI